jgi:branched-subunit amino acid transport protein
MLTALVLPMVAASSDGGSWPITKALAAVIAGVVAYFTHSTLKTLAAGMGALWILEAVTGRFG